jgi:murein DD-endopeptidase MepM/ murein hydrolase activator NlpD
MTRQMPALPPAARPVTGRRRASIIVRLSIASVLAGTAWSCSSPTAPDQEPGASGPEVPEFVSCSAFPDSASSPYVLPFGVGQRFGVTKTFDHYTPGNKGVGLYAIDLAMPMGTAVHAIRAGIAVAVEEGFSDDDHADFHENWVMIRHADDTVGRYIHLKMNGAAVAVGASVTQGQVIGYSGNSGASTGPHLHFDVQTCGPNLPPGYNTLPCGMTVPLSFRNTNPHTCGLEVKASYKALPFTPDNR